ncbi:hypothetical protein NCC78_24730 [Micromonospora phytophila]|uniref:hypothetical protein n=1 Tax=Micromonospora phytophila TaxID=709888 RepID=UPI00202FA260|nr:hypothetical protein [Micromonospora phytophila]MCM0677857.1 hypothetical protein [Micromonospora phytophila]
MRRLLAVTAVTTVLLAVAGCSAGRPETAPATTGTTPSGGSVGAPPTSAGPGAGSGAAGGNAPEVCAAAQQASGTAVRTYVEELGRMMAAVGANDGTAAQAARERAEAALAGWRTALRQQSARADDAQLKTLLTDLATEVDAMGTDVDSIDETELDRLQQRLDQLCVR